MRMDCVLLLIKLLINVCGNIKIMRNYRVIIMSAIQLLGGQILSTRLCKRVV